MPPKSGFNHIIHIHAFCIVNMFNMLPESVLCRTRDAGDLRFYFNERTGKYVRLKGETYKLAA